MQVNRVLHPENLFLVTILLYKEVSWFWQKRMTKNQFYKVITVSKVLKASVSALAGFHNKNSGYGFKNNADPTLKYNV